MKLVLKLNILKNILDYFIHLNIVIATSAGILATGIANIFALPNYFHYGLFSFFSTFCVYNSQRLFKATINRKTPWLKWVFKHLKIVFILSVFSGLIADYFFFRLINNIASITIILFILAIIISFFYVVSIGGNNLREFPYLKIHAIALTWTLIIVLFPIVNENIADWGTLMIFSVAHYCYFVAVAIPFDIRDLNHDAPTQRTIPQVVGMRKAKVVSILLLISTAIGIGIVFPYLLKTLPFVFAILTQIVLVAFTTLSRQEIYYSVLIDGAIALLGISYFSI